MKTQNTLQRRLARNLRTMRTMRGMTQQQLCARSNVTSVAMIEGGDRFARLETLEALADALNVPIAFFFIK
jgi:transcriptional regulator with XRE-family HTH domain